MKKLFSIFSFMLLFATMSFGQAAIDIELNLSDNGTTPGGNVVNFGLDLTATTGIDPTLGESDLPPFPPGGVYEARWNLAPFGVGNLSTYKDYRTASAFPFTGDVEHRLWWQLSSGATSLTVSYNLPPEATIEIKDVLLNGGIFNSGILSGTGSYEITAGVLDAKFIVHYTNIGPSSPGPIFSMSPASLNFGTVGVLDSSTMQVTVSNPGTDSTLEISNAVSTNPEFTFVPNTFPILVAPGGNQVFDVTFTPADDGPETDSIHFTHDGLGGSPTSLPLSGTGQTQGGLLEFITLTREITDNSTNNADTIMLTGYSGQPLKALQFNVLVGSPEGGLIINSVNRGADVPTALFNFSYEIYPGAFLPDGSSIDTIKVVILGNGTNELAPGGDYEIMTFSYTPVSISGIFFTTHNQIANVTGATSTPVVNANIGAGPEETINIYNGVIGFGLLGDVNLDDHVNILDILLMIDYILGRVEFTQQQFDMGDISPWNTGAPLPLPDGVIDVLDLAVLQNIVLTGEYPNGNPVNKIATGYFTNTTFEKLTPGMNAKVTFYLTNTGITVGLESIKKVKGLQMELNELTSIIPQNTSMTSSVFDQSVYYQENSFLRMLSYDGQSLPLNPGEFIIAQLPFNLVNPEDIVVEDLIVADENNKAMQKVEIEIRYEDPSIPLDYILEQNFPNPFNPSTSVKFEVPKDEFVTIKVYDMLGQEVITLYSENTKAGKYTLNWDGVSSNGTVISSGSYIYKMTAGEFIQSKKMMFIK